MTVISVPFLFTTENTLLIWAVLYAHKGDGAEGQSCVHDLHIWNRFSFSSSSSYHPVVLFSALRSLQLVEILVLEVLTPPQ